MEIIGKVDSTTIVHIGQTKNICVICGAEVPEGREVCPICEKSI